MDDTRDMERIGHPLTWKTTCFIGAGGGATVFGHTNGYGDFVLFEHLGWPWPIHECYLRRFELSASDQNAAVIPIARSRSVEGPRVIRTWDTVQDVPFKLMPRGKKLNIVGTVTDLKRRTALAKLLRRPEDRAEVLRRLDGRRDVIEIVDGDNGLKFTAFVELGRSPVQIYDTVAAEVQGLELYVAMKRCPVIVVTKLRVYRGGGNA